MAAKKGTPADAGTLAAGLLVDACQPHSENSLRLEMVRDLALDLGSRLEVLAGEDFAADSLVEAALACADLATLAAYNLPAIPDGERSIATAAVHLATGHPSPDPLVESDAGTLEKVYAENTLKDARSAGRRADLAGKQLEV